MWMSVDRIENHTVILVDDEEKIYRLTREQYHALVGSPPEESHILRCSVSEPQGNILSAVFDKAETERRLAEAQARIERLKKRHSNP